MAVRTENHDLIGWRKQFGTLCSLFQRVHEKTLEQVTVVLVILLIMMLPVDMVARMLSVPDVYRKAYDILGMCFKLTAFAWIGKRIFAPEVPHHSKLTVCDVALLAMLGWSVISTLAAPDPWICFYGDGYRNEGLATYLIYACVYISLRHCSRRENIQRMITALVFAIAAVSVLCVPLASPLSDFLSTFLGMPKSDVIRLGMCGSFYNNNHFSYILGVTTVLAGGLYIKESLRNRKAWYLAIFVLHIHVMILNQSLGGYLAAAIGLSAYLLVACMRKDLQPRKAALLILVYVMVSQISPHLLGDFSGDMAGDMKAAMESIQNPEADITSLSHRIDMWEEALKYIAQRPILGFGPDGSGLLEFPSAGVVHNRPHNEYLQYAVFLGIPGLVMYLIALGSLLVRLLYKFRELSLLCVVLACAVLAYCASAFVGNTMYYTTIYYVAILAMLVNESAHTYSAATAENIVQS